jgi:hypothetical protein
LLAEQGEKAAFAEIRHDLKESKNQKINHVVDKTVKE